MFKKKEVIFIKEIIVNSNINNKSEINLIENGNTILKAECFIGKNGITDNKEEGDNKTPIGTFKFGLAFGFHNKEEVCIKMEYVQINKDLYWVDDVNSKFYNQLIKLEDDDIKNDNQAEYEKDYLITIKKEEKDWKYAEHLIDFKIQYELGIEIKVNPLNIKGKGSAIFLHCKKENYTRGCVSVDKQIMEKILDFIDSETQITIK